MKLRPLSLFLWQLNIAKSTLAVALCLQYTLWKFAIMKVRRLVTLPVRLPLKLMQKLAPNLKLSRIDGRSVQAANITSEIISEKNQSRQDSPPPLEECPICQDAVGVPNPEGTIESWTALHCGHKFGDVCLQTWLQDSLEREDPQNPHPTCPICRSVAKHPECGHGVCVVPTFEMQWYALQQYQTAAAEASAAAVPRPPMRHRNRLQRREGHPGRPSSFTPPKRTADKIGTCSVCAELSRRREREKRIMEMVETDPTSLEPDGELASISRKTTVLHLRRGIRRANRSYGETSNSTTSTTPTTPTTPTSPLEDGDFRGRSMVCNSSAPRIPTPAPIGEFMVGTRQINDSL